MISTRSVGEVRFLLLLLYVPQVHASLGGGAFSCREPQLISVVAGGKKPQQVSSLHLVVPLFGD